MNRQNTMMADSHGDIWVQLVAAASRKPGMFHGNDDEMRAQMLRALRLSGEAGFSLRRLATIWRNERWRQMATRWCQTTVGRATFHISTWDWMIRLRTDDVCLDVWLLERPVLTRDSSGSWHSDRSRARSRSCPATLRGSSRPRIGKRSAPLSAPSAPESRYRSSSTRVNLARWSAMRANEIQSYCEPSTTADTGTFTRGCCARQRYDFPTSTASRVSRKGRVASCCMY